MIEWKKLIENGKQCGIEYHFYNDVKLNKCSCGGNARMYSKENKNKKFSFEHLNIRCEKCNKSISSVYDISGNPSETYKTKEEVIKNLSEEWNERKCNKIKKPKKFNGIFPGNQNAREYNWNLLGIRK